MSISLIGQMNDSRSEGQIAIVLIAETIRPDLAEMQFHRQGSELTFDRAWRSAEKRGFAFAVERKSPNPVDFTGS
jgi:hypothetical protein